MALTPGPILVPKIIQSGNSTIGHPVDDGSGGPFFAGGNVFVVAFKQDVSSGLNIGPSVYMSSDGNSWAEQDGTHAPLVDTSNGSFSVARSTAGNKISIATIQSGTLKIGLYTFDMTNPSAGWATVSTTGPTTNGNGLPYILVERRSTGDWVLFFSNNTGQFDAFVSVFSGSWGSAQQVSSGSNPTYGNGPGLIGIDSADNAYLVWYFSTSSTNYIAKCNVLTAGNSLGSAITVYTETGSGNSTWYAINYNSVLPCTWNDHGIQVGTKMVWALPFVGNGGHPTEGKVLLADITIPTVPTFSFVSAFSRTGTGAQAVAFYALSATDYIFGMTSIQPGPAPQLFISESSSLTSWPAPSVFYDESVNPPVPTPPILEVDTISFGANNGILGVTIGMWSFQGSQNNCEIQYYINGSFGMSLTIACPVGAGSATVGVPYGPFDLVGTTSGGTPPYTWAIISGGLPPGVSLVGSIISGIPLVTGIFNYVVRVTDSLGATADTSGDPCSIASAAPTNPIIITAPRTLRYQIGNPSRPSRWFPHSYADHSVVHYLNEPSASDPNTQQLFHLSGSRILLHGGNDDRGTPISSIATVPSGDMSDERAQKLYVDSMIDADGTGSLQSWIQFNNQVSSGPIVTYIVAGTRIQVQENIASLADLSLYRNITSTFAWTGGPSGPRLYAWEPSGFRQPYLSSFFVSQFLNLSLQGWKHHRRAYIGMITTSPVLFTIAIDDGRTYGPYTIPSTGGRFRVQVLMLDQGIKGLSIAYQLDGQGHTFALFPEALTLETKEWKEDSYIQLAVYRT